MKTRAGDSSGFVGSRPWAVGPWHYPDARRREKERNMLNAGDRAPAFELASDTGETIGLESLRGKRVLLYFYPKADTPGCTKQACAVRDVGPEIRDDRVGVLGISPDPPEKLAAFRAKHDLDFPLLSDPDHAVASAYGAWGEKSMYGKTYEGILRSHVAIDETGKIVKLEHRVKPLSTAALLEAWKGGSI